MSETQGWLFDIITNKHGEYNSDNKNVPGNREKQDKYSNLSVEKVSEKTNMKHLI